MDNHLREADGHIEEAERKAETVDQVFTNATQASEDAHRAIEEIREGLPPLEEGRARVRERFDRNKGELLYVQVSIYVLLVKQVTDVITLASPNTEAFDSSSRPCTRGSRRRIKISSMRKGA